MVPLKIPHCQNSDSERVAYSIRLFPHETAIKPLSGLVQLRPFAWFGLNLYKRIIQYLGVRERSPPGSCSAMRTRISAASWSTKKVTSRSADETLHNWHHDRERRSYLARW